MTPPGNPTRRKPGILRLVFFSLLLFVGAGTSAAWAGAPYLSGDPDMMGYHEWEFFFATQWELHDGNHVEGSFPQLEIGFGVAHNALIYLVLPSSLSLSPGRGSRRAAPEYGFGDPELSSSIRLFAETPTLPQVGIAPGFTIPLSSLPDGFDLNLAEVFMEFWLHKNVGPWLFNGGGVAHYSDETFSVELGAFAQRSFGEVVTLGAEIYETIPLDAGEIRTQLNLALMLDFPEGSLLLSMGPSFGDVDGAQAYAAWLLTI